MTTLQSVPALGTHPASGSLPSRAETRDQLSRATYDLLVIGGGILGISTAWHAAQSGLRVALVDAPRLRLAPPPPPPPSSSTAVCATSRPAR